MKYVYEFTNKRKVTKKEFLRWFEKKFLYTIRKFNMIKNGDIIGYKKTNDFRSIVLEDLLNMLITKAPIEIVKLSNKKANKIASFETSDLEADKIIQEIFKGDFSKTKELPVNRKIIKPLYLFLDKEVLLYAKLKGLKHNIPKNKVDKISKFIEDLEKKHPEIKHSIVNSYLELFL